MPIKLDLKPCPFCLEYEQEQYEFPEYSEIYAGDYVVRCQYCGAMGPPCSTWKEAMKSWDKREK